MHLTTMDTGTTDTAVAGGVLDGMEGVVEAMVVVEAMAAAAVAETDISLTEWYVNSSLGEKKPVFLRLVN